MASGGLTAVPPPQQSSNPSHPRGRPNRHRQGNPDRRPQHRPTNTDPLPPVGESQTPADLSTRNPSLAFRPASVAPPSQPSSANLSSAEHSANEDARTRGGTHRRGGTPRTGRRIGILAGRGGRNGNRAGGTDDHTAEIAGDQSAGNVPAGRQFGERLTTSSTSASAVANSAFTLSADAPEFRPGQLQHESRRGKGGGNKSRPAAPRGNHGNYRQGPRLKSAAPDIATRTHDDISNGLYECPICTSELGRSSRVWSCRTCWTVFHLTCIKKWAANEGSTLVQRPDQGDELPPLRQWRCPGCNLPKDILPSTYACWCGKEADPRPVSGIPPHSCGQTCGQYRALPKRCPHPCELICHAGPCPPCTHKGPTQSCFCGKKSTSRRCVDTDYEEGWSCSQICGDLMPCGVHTCQKPCHEGLCGACEVSIDSRCYCGKVEKPVFCCERDDEKSSTKIVPRKDHPSHVDEWIGSFKCHNPCQREYDCGKHQCERECHPQDTESAHCPRSPDVVNQCPCGKSSLADISGVARQYCTDPIANCDKQCSKRLSCGHVCQQVCHADVCMPCTLTMPISCRCGRVETMTICHQGKEQQPQCMRSCKAMLNCGRHACGERCCAGERKASERQAMKRKLRPLGAPRMLDNDIEAEHICTRPCGRPLQCGNHICPELCHKGQCRTCREAIFEEISCHCGKTVLQPPLPCGTQPPPCGFDCERPKPCGHPQVSHNCHGDAVSCPKCPYLLEKPCMCGKKLLKNQPCWLRDARCGELCGRTLRCGSHTCQKQCHRPGDCEDSSTVCRQACGKAKKACGHPCDEKCHAPSACKEDKPCQNKMFITCNCQHLKQEMKCNASKASEGNRGKSLACDDECARLERNRRLALALNVDPEAHKDEHVPYSTETLRLFQEHVKWGQQQEREFRVFAADEAEKRLRFKPMPSHQRAFLHALAEDFGFDSESMDPEPHRHVAVFKTPRFVMAPMKTLAECVRIRLNAESAAADALQEQRRLRWNNEAYNAFFLTFPRFGLTIEELRSELSGQLQAAQGLVFEIAFLPSEEIVIKGKAATPSSKISTLALEAAMKAMKPSIASIISTKRLASTCQLCTLDSSLNVVRKELDGSVNADGWSRVAAKAAAPRTAPKQSGVGEKSVYTVLGSKLKDAKRKKEEMEKAKVQEPLVDDWEEEVRREEEESKRREGDQSGEQMEEQTAKNEQPMASGDSL